jgi:hypothetical protein
MPGSAELKADIVFWAKEGCKFSKEKKNPIFLFRLSKKKNVEPGFFCFE